MNDKAILELGYHKILRFCQCLANQLFPSTFGIGKSSCGTIFLSRAIAQKVSFGIFI